METIWTNIAEGFSAWWLSMLDNLPAYLAGVLIFIISVYAARFASKMSKRALKARNTDEEISVLIERLVRWSVICIGLVWGLQQTGQDVSALIAGLGILGFTIGFALQDVSANFVAGILLLIQQPFDLGDFIEVSGYEGKVITVDLRATEMLTIDGRQVMIPNSDVFSNPITNFTRTERRRIAIPIGVDYNSNLEKVREVTLAAIVNIPGVLAEPEPSVMFANFGDFAIELTVYYWFSTSETSAAEAKDKAVVAIKAAYEKAGIEMPFPTHTILRQ